MKKFFKNNLWITGALLGAAVGYLYWKYIGCISGTCTIASKPLNSAIYFSTMGSLLLRMFQPKRKLHVNHN